MKDAVTEKKSVPTKYRAPCDKPDDCAPLFITDSVEDWAKPESLAYHGLLMKRPFEGKFDAYASDVVGAIPRLGTGLSERVSNASSWEQLLARLQDATSKMLAVAELPPPLTQQLMDDALLMGRAWHTVCPDVKEFDVKIEIFGDDTCCRWHQDHFVGRVLCTYTGHSGLVHKSPEKWYHADGRIVNRLLLKLDVPRRRRRGRGQLPRGARRRPWPCARSASGKHQGGEVVQRAALSNVSGVSSSCSHMERP